MNFTDTNPFCAYPRYIYQSDEERGLHTVCGGPGGLHPPIQANDSAPEVGPAVLFSEDFLFWPLPEGEWWLRMDMVMPESEDAEKGQRIFCFEGFVDLDY
jgi:hypothetical protein